MPMSKSSITKQSSSGSGSKTLSGNLRVIAGYPEVQDATPSSVFTNQTDREECACPCSDSLLVPRKGDERTCAIGPRGAIDSCGRPHTRRSNGAFSQREWTGTTCTELRGQGKRTAGRRARGDAPRKKTIRGQKDPQIPVDLGLTEHQGLLTGPGASCRSGGYLTLNIPPPEPPPLPMVHCQKPGVTQFSGSRREHLSSGLMKVLIMPASHSA